VSNAFYVIRTAGAAFPRVPFWEAPDSIWRREVSDSIAAHNALPGWLPGMVIKAAWESLQPGWLWCDGSALSRADYPALFAAIGTKWGAGDGATTFNIPTQAQLDAVISEPTPPQVITGGSVEPVTPPTTTPTTPPEAGIGSGGSNIVTGGRPGRGPDVPNNFEQDQ